MWVFAEKNYNITGAWLARGGAGPTNMHDQSDYGDFPNRMRHVCGGG